MRSAAVRRVAPSPDLVSENPQILTLSAILSRDQHYTCLMGKSTVSSQAEHNTRQNPPLILFCYDSVFCSTEIQQTKVHHYPINSSEKNKLPRKSYSQNLVQGKHDRPSSHTAGSTPLHDRTSNMVQTMRPQDARSPESLLQIQSHGPWGDTT